MDNQFEPLATGEVLSIDESAQVLIGHSTFRVGEFAEAIRKQLAYLDEWTQDKNAWFSEDGIPCEVLRFTANGWQKGKVRINLEFCPQEWEDEDKGTAASLDKGAAPVVLADSEDELDLLDSPLDSASFDQGLESAAPAVAPAALVESEDELDLLESPFDSASLDQELAPAALADSEDELDLLESPISLEDEFALETPATSDWKGEREREAPDAIYVEMEQEASILILDNELDETQTPAGLDDFDLGEISQSIEQELELEENPGIGDDDLIDLGEMSLQSEDELDFDISKDSNDDLDFGMPKDSDDLNLGGISTSSDDEFQFEDISLNDEFEDNETDSLLDDVWQDMNQASWQNDRH